MCVVCVSQPGGLLVTVAAVTTAVLQGEEESTDVTAQMNADHFSID